MLCYIGQYCWCHTDKRQRGRWKCGSGKYRSDKVWKAIGRKYSKVPDEISASMPTFVGESKFRILICLPAFLGHLHHITIDSVSDFSRVTRGLVDCYPCAKCYCNSFTGRLFPNMWNITFLWLLYCPVLVIIFSRNCTQLEHLDGF